MLRRLIRVLAVVLAVVGAVTLIGIAWIGASGISAREAPGAIETALARRVRSLAIPAAARDRRPPTTGTPETLRSGLEHFADHCASCHANDGSGETEMGRGMYPPAPDMRKAPTQDLTDGELFYIIEHGVKFTGMPGWGTGTPEGEAASWHLVQFIRHLPNLTGAELEEMKAWNPRSAEEWREEEETRRFLSGEGKAPAPAPSKHPH